MGESEPAAMAYGILSLIDFKNGGKNQKRVADRASFLEKRPRSGGVDALSLTMENSMLLLLLLSRFSRV